MIDLFFLVTHFCTLDILLAEVHVMYPDLLISDSGPLIVIQEKSKIKVKTYDSIMDGDAELVIDAVKAYSLVLSRQADTEDHEIQFDLIYIEKNDEENEKSKERKSVFAVGSGKTSIKKLKLPNFLHLASIGLNELQEEASKEKNIVFKIKEQTVCELEVEFVCKYGQFGYGFSHQLGSNDRTPFQNIEDSIFFRVHGENVRFFLQFFYYFASGICRYPFDNKKPRLLLKYSK